MSGRRSTGCAILIVSALVLLTVAVMLDATAVPDRAVLEVLSTLRQPAADTFFRWATWLGSFSLLAPIAVIMMLGLALRRKFNAVLLFGSVFFGSAATTLLVKTAIGRRRPDLFESVLQALPSDYAFPSGHATHVTAFVFCLIWLARRCGGCRQAATIIVLMSIACLVIVSRLYLQVHWPSDVLGGILVSLSWGSIALALSEPWVNNHKGQS